MIVRAKGILRHRFFGEYSAVVGLEFPDTASAEDAMKTLNSDPRCGGWKQSERQPRMLTWIGSGDTLDALKERFTNEFGYRSEPCSSFGCKNAQHEIDSIAHSIDIGPLFTVEIPVTPSEQKSMF